MYCQVFFRSSHLLLAPRLLTVLSGGHHSLCSMCFFYIARLAPQQGVGVWG